MLTLSLVGLVMVAIALWVVALYNGLVRKRNMVEEAWSGIDVQLKRRAELIPNLVATVKGYAGHEKDTLKEVIQFRSQAQNATSVEETSLAQGMLGAALGKLFALAENYPQLKADSTFLALQHTLNDIEEQVQLARRYYNGSVRELNITVESFPSNLIADRFAFTKAEFFELEAKSERSLPPVTF